MPVAPPPVARELMEPPRRPSCALPVRQEYEPGVIRLEAKCWEAAYGQIHVRLVGLQSAVAVRERAATAAVAVARQIDQ